MSSDKYADEWEQSKSRYNTKHQKYRKNGTYRATVLDQSYNKQRCNFYINKNENESFFDEYPMDKFDIDGAFDRSIEKCYRINTRGKEGSYEIKFNKRKNWMIEDYLNEKCQSANANSNDDECFTVEKRINKTSMYHNEYKIYKYSKESSKVKAEELSENIPTYNIPKGKKIEKQMKIRESKTKRNKQQQIDCKSEINKNFNLKKTEIASCVLVNPISEPKDMKKCAIKRYNMCSSRKRFVKVDGDSIVAYKNKTKAIKKTINVKSRRDAVQNSEDLAVIKAEKPNDSYERLRFYKMFFKRLLSYVKDIKNDGSITFNPLFDVEKTSQSRSTIEKLFIKELHQNTDIKIDNIFDFEIIERTNCCVCFADDSNLNYITLQQCDHTACKDCWKSYIETSVNSFKAINSADVKQLTCLYPNCNSILSFRFLKKIVDKNILHRYVQHYCDLMIFQSDEYISCSDCTENLIVKSTNKTNTSACECGYEVCNDCKSEAHYPISCDQYIYYKDEFGNLLYKNNMLIGKRCPKCRNFIEKNGGCNHMTCFCGTHFCWRCLTVYSERTVGQHDVCIEKETQLFIPSEEKMSALVQCTAKCIELMTFHHDNIESYVTGFKQSIIDGVMKSTKREDFQKAFIDCLALSSMRLNVVNQKFYTNLIESTIYQIFKIIQTTRKIFEYLCGAYHYNLTHGKKNHNLLNYVYQAIALYKMFYSIFIKKFDNFSFIKLFHVYTKLFKLLSLIVQ